jgi:hypothetical protein
MRRLTNLNERTNEHMSVIASDDSEPRMSRLSAELEKHDIDAEVEPVMTARGERYDLLVPKSKEAEANKILTAFHGRGLSRDRSYILPNVPEEASLGERRTETDENIEHEIGEWLERGQEFELGDINEPIKGGGTEPERKVLENNVLFIVLRELEKKVGKLPAGDIGVEMDRNSVDSEGHDDEYRATGKFRIWHDEDSYAQGSFSAEGMAGELQNMTINITQVSGHGKKNPPLRFF